MTILPSKTVSTIRTVEPTDYKGIAAVAKLHMKLLNFGPMAGLGEKFIRQVGYAVNMADGLLRVALCEINGKPVGFVAYTSRSITFHRTGLGSHFFYVIWVLGISIMQDPRRLVRLLRAIKVMISRRTEHESERDPLGEVVAIAQQAQNGHAAAAAGQSSTDMLQAFK